jgi:ferredoxin
VRHLGFIAAGRDAVALDAVLARLVGIDPLRVPTTREAHRRGLGEGRLDAIRLEGDAPGNLAVDDFEVPSNWQFALVPGALTRLAARWFWVRPSVDSAACTGCGDCARACAASAIALEGGKAKVTSERCVSCLCCIEVCPAGAIEPRKSALARLVT